MAGGGKRGDDEASSLLRVTLLVLVTLLAFFATDSSAARVTPQSAIPRQRPAMPTPVAGLKATPKLKPSQQWAIEETGGKLWTMV
ncbi:hypothetical protein OPV22_002338 [Ensete ventricosum]|uniref:Uncharacterized protein n=1 Tax=Ensete ventricosum TaxID=4639 RepID=A0AAV8RXM6_ENSVE|nr:hypothetical protein OPV22_002338 [Ensete ventricosum]